MDRSDSEMDHQIEEFNRNLGELTTFYQRQALIAGVMRAKKDLDMPNSPPQRRADDTYNGAHDDTHLLTPLAKHIVAAAANRAINLLRHLSNSQANLPQQNSHTATASPNSPPDLSEVIQNGE